MSTEKKGIAMILYRLVNKKYDNIGEGECLLRSSDHSNQKLGQGIYFSTDHKSAIEFANTKHPYCYTHLLTCNVDSIQLSDLADLRAEPSLITKAIKQQIPYDEKCIRYCKEKGLKGIIWESRAGWKEIVIHTPLDGITITIQNSEELPEKTETD